MFDFLVRLLNIEEEKMRLFNIENFSNSSAVAGTIYKRQKNSDVDSLVVLLRRAFANGVEIHSGIKPVFHEAKLFARTEKEAT
jgi:hypothetical protein